MIAENHSPPETPPTHAGWNLSSLGDVMSHKKVIFETEQTHFDHIKHILILGLIVHNKTKKNMC